MLPAGTVARLNSDTEITEVCALTSLRGEGLVKLDGSLVHQEGEPVAMLSSNRFGKEALSTRNWIISKLVTPSFYSSLTSSDLLQRRSGAIVYRCGEFLLLQMVPLLVYLLRSVDGDRDEKIG